MAIDSSEEKGPSIPGTWKLGVSRQDSTSSGTIICRLILSLTGFLCGASGKELTSNAGNIRATVILSHSLPSYLAINSQV